MFDEAATLHWGFLINPISGGGVGRDVYRLLPEILDSFGVPRHLWRLEMTEGDRLREQTESLLGRCRNLVAVGGDGTIGFVLECALRLNSRTQIGLIPLGTGNDLGRSLGIYGIYDAQGLLACVRRLLRARAVAIDLWRAGVAEESACLVAYLSVGLDAAVLRSFDQARKQGRIGGSAFGNKCYYAAAFLAHRKNRIPAGWSLALRTADGDVTVDLAGAQTAICLNIDSYAAGAHPAPGGSRDDGLCEVVVLRNPFAAFLALGVSRVWPGALKAFRRLVPSWSAASLSLRWTPEARSKTAVQIDGEDWTDRLPPTGPWEIRPAGRLSILTLQD